MKTHRNAGSPRIGAFVPKQLLRSLAWSLVVISPRWITLFLFSLKRALRIQYSPRVSGDASVAKNDFAFLPRNESEFETGGDSLENLDWRIQKPVFQYGSVMIRSSISDEIRGPVTIDFWDTLVGRARPTDSVERSQALRISLLEWKTRDFTPPRISLEEIISKRAEFRIEQEVNHGEANREVTIRKICEFFGLQMDVLTLKQNEILVERTFSKFIGDEVLQSLSEQKLASLRIVSDTDLSAADLLQIVPDLVSEIPIESVSTSADLRKTKRHNGAIYRDLKLNEENKWIHVGDDRNSDFRQVKSLGGTPYLASRITATTWNRKNANDKELSRDLSSHLGLSGSGRLLVDIATIGSGLASFASERCLHLQKEQVVYLSREGENLSRIHHQVNKAAQTAGLPTVPGRHLAISRTSGFLAQYNGDIPDMIRDVDSRFPLVEPENFFRSIGLTSDIRDKLPRVFSKNLLRPSQIFQQLSDSQLQLFVDESKSQASILLEYLRQEGIKPENSLLADLGWSGTIQRSLTKLVGRDFVGAYMMLTNSNRRVSRDGLFSQLLAGRSRFKPDLVGPIERAFTTSDFRPVKYRLADGVVEPVLEADDSSVVGQRKATYLGNLEEISYRVAESMLGAGIYGIQSKEFVSTAFERFYLSPTPYHFATWGMEVKKTDDFMRGNRVSFLTLQDSKKRNASTDSLLSGWRQGYEVWQFLQAKEQIK